MNDPKRALVSLISQRLPRTFEDAAGLHLTRAAGRPRQDVDLSFKLTGEELTRTVRVQVEVDPRPSEINEFSYRSQEAREDGAIYMLVGPHLDKGMRSALRSHRVSHADLSGTLFVAASDIVIAVDGQSSSALPRHPGGRVNPFSDKASLVIRSLLRNPGRARGVREMAVDLGISAGLVSRVAEILIERGYVRNEHGKLMLADGAAVLLDWVSTRPWSRNETHSFIAPYEGNELRAAACGVVDGLDRGAGALTQLGALDAYASHVVGTNQVHVYCRADLVPAAVQATRLSLNAEPVRRGGNLHLVKPALRQSVFFDARNLEGVRVVSPIQLFIDLTGYPLRGIEGAGMLLRTTLASELGLGRESIARVMRALETL